MKNSITIRYEDAEPSLSHDRKKFLSVLFEKEGKKPDLICSCFLNAPDLRNTLLKAISNCLEKMEQ